MVGSHRALKASQERLLSFEATAGRGCDRDSWGWTRNMDDDDDDDHNNNNNNNNHNNNNNNNNRVVVLVYFCSQDDFEHFRIGRLVKNVENFCWKPPGGWVKSLSLQEVSDFADFPPEAFTHLEDPHYIQNYACDKRYATCVVIVHGAIQRD